MNLYPSILTNSISEYQQQLSLAIESGVINTVQVDVIDGQFADNLTLSPLDLVGIDHGDLEIDFHFMAEEPIDYIRELVVIKDDLPTRAVISQVERMGSQQDYLAEIKNQNWQVGFSLNLHTPVSAIDETSWVDLDIIQLMTIKAGFQGQKFNQTALEKIAEIKQLANKKIEIIVDGGVKAEHTSLLAEKQVAGVSVGSGFWQADDPVTAIQQYSQLM